MPSRIGLAELCFLASGQWAQAQYVQQAKLTASDANNGGGLSNGLPLGASGSVTNSQCTINSSGSSATSNGNNLTLVLNVTFTAAFDGNRVIYAAARDSAGANDSGWQSLGTWSVQ